jgi:hypothetical protein
MLGLRRSWVLLVALVGCGGAPAKPPEQPHQPIPAKPAPVIETADLSPIAAPAGLFVVGRLKRPTALADTVAHWAGVPIGLRDVLPFAAKNLGTVLAWDAPVELAVAVAPSGHRGAVDTGVSLGLTGTEQAVDAARRGGYDVKRLGPETYAVSGIPHLSCVIAPAVGSAAARFVCAHRTAELEDLLPYMTRGLPNEPIGQRDLELELRVEPLRKRFASEIGSARLFAGFLVRELQLDAPRFDTALSDSAYALADELVAITHDVDTLRLEGTVDDQKRLIDADFSIAFGDHKAWSTVALADRGKHASPPPDEFWKLSADAESAGYYNQRDPALYDRLSAGLVELADAYLEHEKIGKATRERLARLIQTYFRWDGAGVAASGADAEPSAKGAKVVTSSAWTLMRIDHPPATLKGSLADLTGLLGDRELRALLARALKVSEKDLPSGRMVPLRAPGVPAGTQALLIKLPSDLGPLVGRSFGLASKDAAAGMPSERAFAVVVNGTGAIVASAESTPVLASRIGQALSGKGLTLATRSELLPMREFNASSAGYATLLAVLTSAMSHRASSPSEIAAGLPHHGQVPMFVDFSVQSQPSSRASWHITIPAAVLEDLPGLMPVLATSLADSPTTAP